MDQLDGTWGSVLGKVVLVCKWEVRSGPNSASIGATCEPRNKTPVALEDSSS